METAEDLEQQDKIPLSFPNTLGRKNLFTLLVRGDDFSINLGSLILSQEASKLIDILRNKCAVIEKDSVSYRVLSHWDSKGILECSRDSEKGWRSFTLVEALWLNIIKHLRLIGLPLEKISKCKPFFFEEIKAGEPMGYVDYYVCGAVFFKKPTYFIVLPDGQAEFLFHHELDLALKTSAIAAYTAIHLNPILDTIPPNKKVESTFSLSSEVSDKEMALLDALRHEDFDVLTVEKKNGEILHFDLKKTYAPNTPVHELMKNTKDGEISVKFRDGKITSTKHGVRNKLKDKKPL